MLPKKKIKYRILIPFLIFFLLILNTKYQIPNTKVHAANFIFGDDASGFFIKDKDTGAIKMRIDNEGYMVAPMKHQPSGDNLLLNGGFESDTDESIAYTAQTGERLVDNWTPNYTGACAYSSCAYALETSNFHGGGKGLKLPSSTGASANLASDPFEVKPGKTYTASIDISCNATISSGITISVIYFTGNKDDANFIDRSGTPATIFSGGCTFNTSIENSWTSKGPTEFTVPSNCVSTANPNGGTGTSPCTKARFLIENTATTGALFVDNAQVTSFTTSQTNAAYISAGQFGANTGGGTYSFPGNVGIGTTGPGAKLEVSGGDIKLSGNVYDADYFTQQGPSTTVNAAPWYGIGQSNLILGGETNSAVQVAGYYGIAFETKAAGTDMTIVNGNVGIGTTGPSAKLHIEAGATEGLRIISSDAGNTHFAYSSGDNYISHRNTRKTYFRTYNGSGYTNRVVIDGSGNVGIGTTGPSSELDLYKASSSLGVEVERGDGATTILRAGASEGLVGTQSDHDFTIWTNNSRRVTFDNSGNVGIGTTGPGYVLDAVSNVNADAFRFYGLSGTTGEKDVFIIQDPDVGGGGQDESSVLKVIKTGSWNSADQGSSLIEVTYTGVDSGPDEYYIVGRLADEGAVEWGVDLTDADIWSTGGIILGVTGADGGTYSGGDFIFDSTTGNVGIGTTGPSYKLQVVGSLYVSGSSKDFKQNISSLEIDTSKLYQLNPVSFDFKPKYKDLGKQLGGGRQFGLIAEEVYQVIPELAVSDGEKIANVDYEKLGVLLLNEVKKHKHKIVQLEEENKSLNKKLENLEKLLERL